MHDMTIFSKKCNFFKLKVSKVCSDSPHFQETVNFNAFKLLIQPCKYQCNDDFNKVTLYTLLKYLSFVML